MPLQRSKPLPRNTKPIARRTPLKRSTVPLRRTALKRSTKPLKRTPIKRKTYLEAILSVKNGKKLTTNSRKALGPSKRPIPKLKAEADKWFSQYIRYRDGRFIKRHSMVSCPSCGYMPNPDKGDTGAHWETICITCAKWNPLKKMQAGHFVSRTINELRFDEENVNGQCYGCNVMQNGQLHFYYAALDVKYGEGTAARLLARRSLMHKLTYMELELIINDAKTCIEHYKLQEDGHMADKKQSTDKKEAKKPLNTAITNPDEPANKKYKRRSINIIQK